MEAIIFTDGASRGNPGPGGWGAVVVFKGAVENSANTTAKVFELGGFEPNTTNNRMELLSVISALVFIEEKCKHDPFTVLIYTDSKYVLRGSTEWLAGWEQKGWMTAGKKEVSNKDLWERMSAALSSVRTSGIQIHWHLLSGHIGITGNERADKIATSFALGKPSELFSGSLTEYKDKIGADILDISHDAEMKKEKSSSKSRSNAKAFSYVSMVDGVVETHKTWAECEARVRGKKAFFKKATSPEEEQAIIQQFKTKGSY